jgi:hypothetical protein
MPLRWEVLEHVTAGSVELPLCLCQADAKKVGIGVGIAQFSLSKRQ